VKKDNYETTLAESSVSLKLALIQRRCRELADTDEFGGLSLEEPIEAPEDTNPYNRG
jgi:hypothetical protein